MSNIELFDDSISGNCYKLQLACAQLGVAYDWHDINIMAGQTRTPDYLGMNPNINDWLKRVRRTEKFVRMKT
jgi:glutathione S-transferase